MRILLIVAAFLIFPVSSFAKTLKDALNQEILEPVLKPLDIFEYNGKITFYGTHVDSLQNNANIAGINLFFDLKYEIADDLKALFKGGVILSTGSSESVYNDDFASYNGFYLSEVLLAYDPFSEMLKFELGAINQNRYRIPILIKSAAFPGAIESSKIKLPYESFILLSAQQSIPSTRTHTSRVSNVKEGTPSLFIERIMLAFNAKAPYKPATKKPISFQTSFAHFKFTNLSRSVANQSRFYGNDVIGRDEFAKFSYRFEGYWTNVAIAAHLFDDVWHPRISGDYVFNEQAPDGKNTGYIISLDNQLNIKKYQVMLTNAKFRNEANTSPGYYNSGYFGHNNRVGWIHSIEVEKKDSKFSFEASFSTSDTIKKSIYQSKQNIIKVNFAKKI